MHSTGRSAAFWLAHYGGAPIMPLSVASRRRWRAVGRLRSGRSSPARRHHDRPETTWTSRCLSVETRRRRDGRDEARRLNARSPALRAGWDFGLEIRPAPTSTSPASTGMPGAVPARGGDPDMRAGRAVAKAGLADRWQEGETFTADTSSTPPGPGPTRSRVGAARAPLGVRLAADDRAVADGPRGPARPAAGDRRTAAFYFKGEGDDRLWLSPHDETRDRSVRRGARRNRRRNGNRPLAIGRRLAGRSGRAKWAGLGASRPRVPAYGFEPRAPGFFWCAGQGGFGIQTAPRGVAALAAALLLGTRAARS